MHTRIAVLFVAVAALLAIGVTTVAQSPDPWLGTWKVNLAKSTYSPGPKPTTAGTVTMAPSAGGFTTMIDGVDPQGQATHTETMGMFDGKDNVVKGAAQANSTSAYKRIDGRTFEVMGKVDGKSTVTTMVVISADGRTLTATQEGKNASGETVANVIVADRQ